MTYNVLMGTLNPTHSFTSRDCLAVSGVSGLDGSTPARSLPYPSPAGVFGITSNPSLVHLQLSGVRRLNCPTSPTVQSLEAESRLPNPTPDKCRLTAALGGHVQPHLGAFRLRFFCFGENSSSKCLVICTSAHCTHIVDLLNCILNN